MPTIAASSEMNPIRKPADGWGPRVFCACVLDSKGDASSCSACSAATRFFLILNELLAGNRSVRAAGLAGEWHCLFERAQEPWRGRAQLRVMREGKFSQQFF